MANFRVSGFGGTGKRGVRGSGGLTIQVDLPSLRRVLNNIDKKNKKAIASFKRAFAVEGRRVMAKAKEYTPVVTGALKKSGELFPHRGVYTTKEGFHMNLSFGGKNVRIKKGKQIQVHYALYVHEGSGRGRKYLERAAKRVSRGMAQRVAAQVKM